MQVAVFSDLVNLWLSFAFANDIHQESACLLLVLRNEEDFIVRAAVKEQLLIHSTCVFKSYWRGDRE